MPYHSGLRFAVVLPAGSSFGRVHAYSAECHGFESHLGQLWKERVFEGVVMLFSFVSLWPH